MNALNWIAEQRILEAVLAGELDNLPGAGQPLSLDSDRCERSANRLAYKVLKNAGFLPLTLLLRREVEVMMGEAESLLQNCRERTTCLCDEAAPESSCGTFNHTVQTFREYYAELLHRINQKINELRNACIRDEVMNDLRCAGALEIPPMNIFAKLRQFDAEFLPDSITDSSS